MKAERSEVMRLMDKQIKDSKVSQASMMEQSAVEKQHLTNDPHWNIFVQELQKLIDNSENNLDSLKNKLIDPNTTSQDESTQIKNMILIEQSKSETLKMVINIPKRVIEEGKKASDFLWGLFSN